MRKVYQNESKMARLPVAVIFGVGFTAVLFGFIPLPSLNVRWSCAQPARWNYLRLLRRKSRHHHLKQRNHLKQRLNRNSQRQRNRFH